ISLSLDELKDIITECVGKSIGQIASHDTTDEILNQKEASEFLGISEVTLIKWKKEGRVPCEQLPGSRIIRYYKSQLREVLSRNRHLLQASRK
ncbi:helix-turn-helix domain-containing protein, partial [Fulvivirga aurantia]|uniref:helix-turn-helix domain-containing protein n=1 Tax=Fulvivirga aurantia TaxID=2529383 RepID=UPI0012BD4CBA